MTCGTDGEWSTAAVAANPSAVACSKLCCSKNVKYNCRTHFEPIETIFLDNFLADARAHRFPPPQKKNTPPSCPGPITVGAFFPQLPPAPRRTFTPTSAAATPGRPPCTGAASPPPTSQCWSGRPRSRWGAAARTNTGCVRAQPVDGSYSFRPCNKGDKLLFLAV